MKITWFGHSAFRLEFGDAVVMIDPFLTGNPAFSGDAEKAGEGATHVLLTHGHGDHIGDTVAIWGCGPVGLFAIKSAYMLGAERVICWVCLGALPITLPIALWLWPANAGDIRPSAWAGFAYVGTVSMWAGFFAWYRGLDWGGALRVSQTQLLQPFLAMLFAWPLLGERLDAVSIGFALAVVATVFLSRRLR